MSNTEHKNLTAILQDQSGAEVELKLDACTVALTTDLDASTHTLSITWSFQSESKTEQVKARAMRAAFTNHLKGQEA